ncbi:MAG: DNA primase [Deltaproteobacteria bacterium]|nr:DNA primase [Deltaproteobacteria bacterium]
MAERIPEEVLTDIRARVSIVEVISSHVALRKAGRSYTGLCPFHNESTPSFSVNEEGGFFHCFGCGAGGNAFSFLTRVEGISFPEAVRRLAAKSGVALPQSAQDPQARERLLLLRLNEVAATYFQRCLWGNIGDPARRYLTERGLERPITEQFRLGFAPPGREGLTRFLSGQRADLDKASELGLIGKGADGRYYDKFRHRLMFPITDIVGRIVGFGGRLLPMAVPTSGKTYHLPKYLNSPDSVLYKKGALLYGLSQAKDAIRQRGRAIFVEGYIDLLALVQCGQTETVAVLGTALGVEQLKTMSRATGVTEACLFFDGDEAGRRAALRAFPLCIEAEVRGRGVFLPQGEDPDTFVRKQGAEAISRLVDQAEPLEDFYFARHAPPPGASALQRAQAARSAMAVLSGVSDAVARGAFLTQIAQRFSVNEEELRRTASAAPEPTPSAAPPRREKEERLSGQAAVEAELIQLMLLDRHCALRLVEEDIFPAFQQWGALAQEISEAWRQSEHIDLSAFFAKLPKKLADLVSRAYGRALTEEEEVSRQRLFADCVTKLRDTQRKSAKERVLQELREAERRGDEAAVRLGLQRLR